VVEALIISYNALPLDVVSSYRSKAYCDHLMSFGIRPTLLTHRWEKKVNGHYRIHEGDDKIVFEENEACKVIRLPHPGMDYSQSKLHTLLSYLNSNLDVGLMQSYRLFRKYLRDHLKEKRYDVIIAVYNPHFHLKLAYECWQEFGIPYVLDFRDLWNNNIVTRSYNPGFKERTLNSIIARCWRKWIRSSLFFSTTGQTWTHYLSRLSGRDGIVVRNGFDYLPTETKTPEIRHDRKFKVVHFGRMYEGQAVDIFLKGFREFANRLSPSKIGFEIIGLKKVTGINYEEKIGNSLGDYVTFLPYMEKRELVKYCVEQASIFFFPNFIEDNGQFPVKIYDYVMIAKNILVTHGGGEISDFVLKLGAGVVADEPESVTGYLEKFYREFENSGSIKFYLNNSELKQYSREMQVRVMAEKIHHVLARSE